MNKVLEIFLKEQGYTDIKEMPDGKICCLNKQLFTTGLLINVDMNGIAGRYCYKTYHEAKQALTNWDGIGDPSGSWIVYKGEGGERKNVIKFNEEK